MDVSAGESLLASVAAKWPHASETSADQEKAPSLQRPGNATAHVIRTGHDHFVLASKLGHWFRSWQFRSYICFYRKHAVQFTRLRLCASSSEEHMSPLTLSI